LDDVPALSAFQLFQHQLDSNSVEAAVDAMKRLGVVATAMGATECIQKLLPYLTNQVAAQKSTPPFYADEVLLILGQEMPVVLQVIGKKHYAEAVPLLERLASVEETVVREQAVSVLQSMAPDMVNVMTPGIAGSSSQQTLLVSLVKRLGSADWFTAKVSACGILPNLFSAAQSAQQNQDLLHLYRELCHDETPMVRRAAAKHLGRVVQSAGLAAGSDSSHVLEFVLQTLPTLMNDEQDSVRLLAAASMADAAVLATQPQWSVTHILPFVKQASTDTSW
jgi:serine/threonine-protein phosphatase 2A regulatory subunit A